MSSRIYLTPTDNQVLKFVEQNSSITIEECRKIFYNTQKNGYEIARRRLGKLVNYNKLKMSKDAISNQNVYYMTKKLSYHNILALDYYANLVSYGANIVYFNRDQEWMSKKYFSDAFCCYHIGNRMYFDIIEVVRTHALDVEKYLKLYKSNEPQELCNIIYRKEGGEQDINKFPRLIVIDDVRHKNELFVNDKIKIYQLDFQLSNLSKILI